MKTAAADAELMSADPTSPLRIGQTGGLSARFVWTLWWVWILFVVYGSLVPLEFRAIPLDEALERFARVPMLNIGQEGRADWIANGVLYVPVGFLTAALLAGSGIGQRLFNSLLALGFGLVLAVAVEFSQLYFPQRTVSLNDLLAEVLGTALGVLLAWRGTVWLSALLMVLRGHWREVAASLVPGGALVILLVSLFPFDVLVSSAELAGKASSSFWGWFVAPVFVKESLIRQLARLVAEAMVLVPVGALWARSVLADQSAANSRASLQTAFWLGASLGMVIEVGQWFMVSGVSQGLSVLTRGLGWLVGAWLWNRRHVWGVAQWRAALRQFVWPLAGLHLLAVVILSGLGGSAWRTIDEAVARLVGGELRFVPFYYHYYTSEAVALQSLLTVGCLYAPIGLWCWASALSARHAAWIAALTALLVEAGKLFPMASRPDPTNIFIAAAAAALSLLILQRFSDLSHASVARHESQVATPARKFSAETGGVTRPVWWLLPIAAYAVFWLFQFPVYQLTVGLVLAGCALLVWWHPVLIFGLIAAALPSWDLSALSGREYVDEFDLLLLVTLGVAWVRQKPGNGPPSRDVWLNTALGVFAISAVIAALMAWRPWDLGALQDPHTPLSPWYALRLVKGLFWALCLYLLARRAQASGQPVVPAFGIGLVVGLAYVCAFIFWERAAFVGLWDFSVPYRVAGPVVPMRLGGAYLDAFLIAALPFALVGALFGKSIGWRIFCAVTALAAAYAIAVTFTRTTHFAAAVGCLLIALAALRPWPGKGASPLLGIMMLTVMVAAAYPIVTGPFASARLANIEQDFRVRIDHFSRVVSMGSTNAMSSLLGHGLGRFPAETYWTSVTRNEPAKTMAVHRFLRRGDVSELQLGPGPHLYLDQFVDLQPGETVQLALKARAVGDEGALSVFLCQKWLLSSDRCVATGFSVSSAPDGWQTFSASVFTGLLGEEAGWLSRPVRLALHNTGSVRIDIGEVSLLNAQGHELLRNGRFESGSDHWSYTSDDHLAWHVKNMFIAVWFDQGIPGLLALVFLLSLGVRRSARAAWGGDRSSLALCAALVGLLIVSVFDSITDEPRYLLLLLCMAWMAAFAKGRHLVNEAPRQSLSSSNATPQRKKRRGLP